MVIADETLADNLKRGDRDALAALVERYHAPLVGYLYRLTGGDAALAEDMVQESFLRVIRGIQGYDYPRPFRPWLYAIATNLARDHYKSAGARFNVALLDEPPYAASTPTPEYAAIADEESAAVRDALMALPDHQRAALVLRYYQGLTLAEIAEVLHVPVGTVKSRLSLGIKRLRDMLAEEKTS